MKEKPRYPNRIDEIRIKRGMSVTELEAKSNISRNYLFQLRMGDKRLNQDTLSRLAKALQVDTSEIIAHNAFTVPVVGYIGAGAQIYPIDDHPKGFGLEEVEAPPVSGQTVVALQVQGDSMYPAYRDGDLVYYTRDCDFNEQQCMNEECVVEVADGPTYLKIITKGSGKNLFTLTSYNAPPIQDVKIQWACPVLWVRRRRSRSPLLTIFNNP